MSNPPPYDFGDLIDWLDNPVMVLGPPRNEHNGAPMSSWVTRVAYLSRHGRKPSSAVVAGQVLDSFHIEGKAPWTGDLDDEQARLYGVLLLTEGAGK